MINTLLRLTAVSIVASKLLTRTHRQPVQRSQQVPLTEEELVRRYGTPGEVLLERMGTFDFAPGAVDEMMAAIEDAFERVPESEQ